MNTHYKVLRQLAHSCIRQKVMVNHFEPDLSTLWSLNVGKPASSNHMAVHLLLLLSDNDWQIIQSYRIIQKILTKAEQRP